MTLTRGAGAMSISPTLRFYSVVPDDTPTFELLRTTDDFPFVHDAFLELFRAGKAAPTDRLADGTTLLHVWKMLHLNGHQPSLERIQKLLHALIEIGAPTGEENDHGYTAFDIMVWNNLNSWSDCPQNKGVPILQLEMMQTLLNSGDCLKSLDKNADRQRWYTKCPFDSPQAMQVVRILKDKGELEDIEPTRIEDAIIMKHENDLEYSLATEHWKESDVLEVLDFQNYLSCCVGWIPGRILLRESSLPRDSDATWSSFYLSCWVGDLGSALLLLEYTTTIPNEILSVSAYYQMPEVLVRTISALVKQRQELQDLATRSLPREALCALTLPQAGLLDAGAYPVYSALVKCGIELDSSATPPKESIYTEILSTETADMLYEAGFIDLSQRLLTETLRYATFKALGMTHTCHGTDFYRTRCTPEEIAEIRDEDSTSIRFLVALMVEFSQKYDELDLSMSEFIKSYWSPCMDEINEEADIHPEDAKRIREVGVIIKTDR
ncbi:uncharacterized protein BDV14DRAFT_202228 [Aspergillus stella-maris]|uniref:uncharacterized protein n=1 Tax=Aspergillus stella-maris TaxID=1810926 RepID=UPI003CCE3B99